MAQKYQSFPGMEDILPGDIEKWQWLEEKARIFFEALGFKEIRTPVLEPTELFTRSIGEASDIVHKEMYTFEDRGGRSMTMRPEMTASVARAVIEKGLLKTNKSLRFYYVGPMFRAERPQAGRKRQFHQIGVEMINEGGTDADFEVISGLYQFLTYAGVKNPLMRINDLGGQGHREKLLQGLVDYFSTKKQELCDDCRWRLEKNVLRIFDCKVSTCQPVIHKAPWEDFAPLSDDFKKLAAQLEVRGLRSEINRRLVRGLDYYNGAVFEITAEGLGAQDAVAGGGRYDGLYAELGGPQVPCTGFSIGMERLLMVLEKQQGGLVEDLKKRRVYIAKLDLGSEVSEISCRKAIELRAKGIRVEMLPREVSLSSHLKKANQLGIRYVLILGPDEVKKQTCAIKDLDRKEQSEIGLDELIAHMERMISL